MGHGQMSERELELRDARLLPPRVQRAFVCTTIIESGIDIVDGQYHHHQTRRSARLGTAALTARPRRPLAPSGVRVSVGTAAQRVDAATLVKRLEAIESLEELGFRASTLATHDLEMARGAGELLGEGHRAARSSDELLGRAAAAGEEIRVRRHRRGYRGMMAEAERSSSTSARIARPSSYRPVTTTASSPLENAVADHGASCWCRPPRSIAWRCADPTRLAELHRGLALPSGPTWSPWTLRQPEQRNAVLGGRAWSPYWSARRRPAAALCARGRRPAAPASPQHRPSILVAFDETPGGRNNENRRPAAGRSTSAGRAGRCRRAARAGVRKSDA